MVYILRKRTATNMKITFDNIFDYYQRDCRFMFQTTWLDTVSRTTRIKDIPLKSESVFHDAFTHPSYAGQLITLSNGSTYVTQSYQQLEFLGDSIVNTCIVNYLLNKYPDKDEGFLSKMKIKLIQTKQLAKFATDIQLDKFIKINSIQQNMKMTTLEDVFEAFIGAMFKTFGFDYCLDFLSQLLDKYVDLHKLEHTNDNYKDTLMRYFKTLKNFNDPRYYLVFESNYKSLVAIPKSAFESINDQTIKQNIRRIHNKVSTEITAVEVFDVVSQRPKNTPVTKFVQDFVIVGYGYNYKKKLAEQFAAKNALEAFKCPFNF